MLPVPVTVSAPVCVIAPVDASAMLPAVLALSAMAESSLIDTRPGELNVSEPKFTVSPALLPRSIDAPLRLALPVTSSLVPPSLIAPPELRTGPPAVLFPVSAVAEASVIDTAPVVLKVRVPKLLAPALVSVIALAPAAKLALFVTDSVAPAASVMAPAEVSERLEAELAPASCVALASAMVTAPPAKLRLPKVLAPALDSVIALAPAPKLALWVTDNVAPGAWVMSPKEPSVRKFVAVFAPASCVASDSKMVTESPLNVRLPNLLVPPSTEMASADRFAF